METTDQVGDRASNEDVAREHVHQAAASWLGNPDSASLHLTAALVYALLAVNDTLRRIAHNNDPMLGIRP